jgi:hypothetical protein
MKQQKPLTLYGIGLINQIMDFTLFLRSLAQRSLFLLSCLVPRLRFIFLTFSRLTRPFERPEFFSPRVAHTVGSMKFVIKLMNSFFVALERVENDRRNCHNPSYWFSVLAARKWMFFIARFFYMNLRCFYCKRTLIVGRELFSIVWCAEWLAWWVHWAVHDSQERKVWWNLCQRAEFIKL